MAGNFAGGVGIWGFRVTCSVGKVRGFHLHRNCQGMEPVIGFLMKLLTCSPVVPFFPFFGSRFLYKVTNPKKGALIMIWVLGY